jgi:hypothetical protein
MKRRIGLLAALLATPLGLLVPAVHAADADAAYCPIPTATGHVVYNPGVAAAPSPNTFTMTVSCNATGVGDDSGPYALTLSGSTLLDTCVSGTGNPQGSGTLSGTGPEGTVAGTFTFTKPGIHYYISGSYTSGGENHNLQLWMDVINQNPSTCFYNQADVVGHGTFADVPPPPTPSGAISAHVTGQGTIAPGLTTVLTPNSYTFSGQATGLFNGIPGSCSAFFNGSSSAFDTMASGQGSFSGSCSGADALGGSISVSCSGSFTRVTTSVAVTGNCSGTTTGSLTGAFTLTFTTLNPATSFIAEGDVTVS